MLKLDDFDTPSREAPTVKTNANLPFQNNGSAGMTS
jgi:hypothetical protein